VKGLVMGNIRVLIGDDHATFREGLCRLLSDEKGFEVVSQAENGEEVVVLSKELKPDVALLDINMPKLNGIEATKLIKEHAPKTVVLVFSAFNYQTYVLASLRAGAVGYLTKDTPVKDVVNAVRSAYAGELIIDRSVTNDIIRQFMKDKNGKKTNQSLNPREMDTLKVAAKGMRNKEIAKELNISDRTVQAHLNNIFNKLEVNSRTEAVLKAVKEGLLDICDLN
jgi:DNA-binding NarL/FixJ family response regulator